MTEQRATPWDSSGWDSSDRNASGPKDFDPSAPRRTAGPTRDRRGRGPRGPEILPRTRAGERIVRPRPTRRERFDSLVLGVVSAIDERWHRQLGLVEFAVEDTPLVPDDWDVDSVPLSSLIRGTGTAPTRLVVFRRSIEHRCEGREELEALVLTVVVEQVAELLGVSADEVDPRYGEDDS